SVFANKSLLNSAKSISISAKDMPLRDFLDVLFRDQPLDYEIKNKTIFIKRKINVHTPVLSPTPPPVKMEAPPLEVTGVVLDAEGAGPLQGATVTVQGTRNTVMTAADGRFSINAEPDQVLVVSFI